MRKINKNVILFILVFMFSIAAVSTFVFSEEFFKLFTDNTALVRNGEISLSSLTSNIEEGIRSNLTVHDAMMDLYSLKMRFTGTDVVVKSDGTTLVRTDNDLLAAKHGYVEDEYLEQYAEQVDRLYKASEKAGAGFLYVEAPAKGYDEEYPGGVPNFEKSNYDRFAQLLDEKNIPLLNLRSEMTKDGLSDADAFYVTDHHWKVETGFWAFGKICEKLNSDYGFSYDDGYTNIDNYDVKEYEDWFLGSYGKKVGKWFTPLGVDDISLITPEFETDLTEEQPIKGTVRNGDFSETVLYTENILTRDYYHLNPYATYSGGDLRLQIMRNNLNTNGKKILVIRDSFACAVTPFLSLVFSEEHITDTRNFEFFVGDKLNVFEYIEEIKPDYVIVLYYSIGFENGGRFDFE